MSYFLCPSDGKRYDIFGNGGGEREAARLKVPLLGQIPIDIATREAGDRGLPDHRRRSRKTRSRSPSSKSPRKLAETPGVIGADAGARSVLSPIKIIDVRHRF